MDIVWIAWAIVLIIIVSGFAFITAKLKGFFRNTSRMAFGTDTLKQGLDEQAVMLSKRPKSVSSMTSVYLPQIIAEFPEFNWEEFRQKGENMLKSALTAITTQNHVAVIGGSNDLNLMVEHTINDHKNRGIVVHYDAVKIHRTEINTYIKSGGLCVIGMQSAVQYFRYTTKESEIIDGSNELLTQTKYNVDLIYVQDEEIVKQFALKQAITGLKCPNCGANITSLGTKICEYCGGNAREININAWQFNTFSELHANIVV